MRCESNSKKRSHRPLAFGLLALGACGDAALEKEPILTSENHALASGVIAQVNGEGATVYTNPASTNTVKGELIESGVSYDLLEQPEESRNERHRALEQIKHHLCLEGDRCLVFQGYESTDTSPDRLEVRLSEGTDPNGMDFDEWRYLKFQLKIHPDTQDPPQRIIISQTWQHGSTPWSGRNYALGPAFAIMLSGCRSSNPSCTPDHMDVDFAYRNEPSTSNPAQTFLVDTIRKDTWYTYYIQMKARHTQYTTGRGAILVWRDNDSFAVEQALNYDLDETCQASGWPRNPCHKFYWGYPVDPPGSGGLKSYFDVRVGLYRASSGGSLTWNTFWMDSIKLTSSAVAMHSP